MAEIFKHDKFVMMGLCLIYLTIGMNTDRPTMDSLCMMGWFTIFQFVFSLFAWVKKGNQWLSPYVVFLVALYVFSTGQSFLWAFNFTEFERTLVGFQGITVDEVFKAQIHTAVMLAFFQIGASTYLSKRKKNTSSNYVYEDVSSRLKQIGWLMFIVSVIPYVQRTISDMELSMLHGYGAIYQDAAKVGLDNLSGIIADYFVPSIICLLIAYRNKKGMRNLFVVVLLLNVVVIMLTGGRSYAVILLALLLIIYHYLVKPFTRKWLFVGILGGFILLQLLSYIAVVRTESNRNVNVTEVKLEDNAAVDAVAEMGGSMFCLIKTQGLVPQKYDYRYGRSYLFAFTTIIPNLGFWEMHPARKESNLSDWLTEELNLSYGTGFSMCAEAYVNFGVFSFVVFFFWGMFLAKIFGNIEPYVKNKDYASLAFLLILFWFFLILPRNNFINLVRPIFFIAGPIYLYSKKNKFRSRYS